MQQGPFRLSSTLIYTFKERTRLRYFVVVVADGHAVIPNSRAIRMARLMYERIRGARQDECALLSESNTDLPVPPRHTHLMLAFKASWVPARMESGDLSFDEYPHESLAQWHRRLGLGGAD